jgi:hypothetical protein
MTLFRERLSPKPLVWVLLAAAPAAVGIAYGAAFTPTLGWVIFLSGLVVVVLLVILGSPLLVVTDREVIAGRAVLPRSAIGQVTPLTGQAGLPTLRAELRAAATAFTLVRAWSGGTGIRIDLADPDDPHPCWLLSSRRPQELAQVLEPVSVPAEPGGFG